MVVILPPKLVSGIIRPLHGKRAQLAKGSAQARAEKAKASIRAKVEHAFSMIKQRFGYSKVRYRGLAKNTNRLYMLAGFANLLRARNIYPLRRDKSACDLPKGRKLAEKLNNHGKIGRDIGANGNSPRES
jgi:hypothetical protein